MTTAELNRDIKRLKNLVISGVYDEGYVKKEISRLYYADDDFRVMNKASILTLIRLNGRFRVIPLHMFGINIDLDKI